MSTMTLTAADLHAQLVRNADDYWADRIDYETFDDRQRLAWYRVDRAGVRSEVLALLRAAEPGREPSESPCLQCEEPIGTELSYETVAGDEVHERCRDEHEQHESEAAYESFVSDFYGGEGPCTQEEHYQAAARERREHDRAG